jgi:peptidoglycan/LPS O-acetylase OafA/YrhL
VSKALHTTLPLPSKLWQIDGLQVLRAVAVLLVAWFHAGLWMGPLAGVTLPTLGVFGIDIFFCISGFIVSSVVMRMEQEPGIGAAWSFLHRRLIRIFPIYWVFAVAGILRLALSHQLWLHDYVPAFFLLPGLEYPEVPLLVGFSWTMVFEMFFYYVLSLILLITVRRAVPISLAILSGAVLAGAFLDFRRPVWIVVCNPILLEFVLGALVALAYRRFGTRRRMGMVLVIIGALASLSLFAIPFPVANGLPMVMTAVAVKMRVATWGMAAVMIVGGVVFWSPSIKSRAGTLAVVLGNASYSAYLASALVIEFTMRLLIRLFGGRVPYPLARVATYQTVTVIMVFTVGWACYQFLEWPLLRWLQSKAKAAGLARAAYSQGTRAGSVDAATGT